MFINEIRPNRLDTLIEHVISEINIKNRYKIALILCAKHFACQNLQFSRKQILRLIGYTLVNVYVD